VCVKSGEAGRQPSVGSELAGDNNVVVQVGTRQSVIVHANGNPLKTSHDPSPVPQARDRDNTRPPARRESPMFVAVSVPSLDRLTLQGDGNIRVTGINSRRLTVALPGSGDTEATGRTTKLAVTLGGAGTALLRPLVGARREGSAQR
jgi:hypothetical protein